MISNRFELRPGVCQTLPVTTLSALSEKPWRPLLPITNGIFRIDSFTTKSSSAKDLRTLPFYRVGWPYCTNIRPNNDKPGGRWRSVIIYRSYKTEHFTTKVATLFSLFKEKSTGTTCKKRDNPYESSRTVLKHEC